MNRKKTLLSLIFALILGGGCSLTEKQDRVEIDSDVLKNLSYITATENSDVVYTTAGESYMLHKDREQHLQYKVISKFEGLGKNLFIAKKDKKSGIIDKDLAHIIAFNYDSITNLGNNHIIGENDGTKFLIDIKNYEIRGSYDNIYTYDKGKVFKVEKSGDMKYLNEKGEEIKYLKDKNILFFRDGKAVIEKDNLFGIYDINEEISIPEENQEIYFSQKNILTKKNDKYFFNGNELEISRFYPTMSDVVIYDFKDGFGLFNLKDGVFYKEVYDEIAPNFDRYIIVGKDNKYNLMDKYKEKDMEYIYDYVIKLGQNSFAVGTDDTGMFALVVGDKKVTEEVYDSLVEINPNYFVGNKDDIYTILNRKGEEVVSCPKDKLRYYNNSVAIVEIEGKEYVYPLEKNI